MINLTSDQLAWRLLSYHKSKHHRVAAQHGSAQTDPDLVASHSYSFNIEAVLFGRNCQVRGEVRIIRHPVNEGAAGLSELGPSRLPIPVRSGRGEHTSRVLTERYPAKEISIWFAIDLLHSVQGVISAVLQTLRLAAL